MDDEKNTALSGAVLVSNTFVCEPSRLISNGIGSHFRKGTWYDGRRIFDLMSLIESIILYDNLYTLPASLSKDASELEFRNALISNGILKELETGASHDKIGNSILQALQSVQAYELFGSAETKGRPIDFNRIKWQLEEFLLINGKEPKRYEWGSSHRLDDTKEEHERRNDLYKLDSFDEFARLVVGLIEYHGSGAYEETTSVLRDMYYIYAAEEFSIPYWIQFDRLEFARNFPNYINQDIRFKLYEKLADGLGTAITDVYEDLNEKITYIPPFSALVLSRASKKEKLIEAILSVREEYRKLRKQFKHLEEDRKTANSIKERKRIRLEQERLLNDAAKAFDRPSVISIEGIVRYIPEVTKPLANPADPTKYSADLLLKPMEWLLKWWKNRPISMIFNVADKVAQIDNYENLIKKVFGANGKEVYKDYSAYLLETVEENNT